MKGAELKNILGGAASNPLSVSQCNFVSAEEEQNNWGAEHLMLDGLFIAAAAIVVLLQRGQRQEGSTML